ncbi:MAG: ABC-F family ATP-binding cassette domain-containing protein [Acidobacteriota bacterium]
MAQTLMLLADKVEKRFGPQRLFTDLTWQILPGQRIGLVGPNGAGKTTLVKILAGAESPDAGRIQKARSVRVGYLPQEVMEMTRGVILEETLAGHGEVTTLEARLHRLEEAMAAGGDARRVAAATEEYGPVQERFAALGGYDLEARAKVILTGLGFDPERLDQPLRELSGGWQMRVALARLLLQEPDLLLLDEPTNHLDLESLEWLEEFLLARKGAYVVISHDRYFLNRMVTRIVELSGGRMATFTGNYDAYQVEKERRFTQVEAAARRQAAEVEKAQRFIDRFRYTATKARQVQSRVKMLEKMDRVEAPVRDRKTVHFRFPQPPRGGAISIQLDGLVKRYGDHTVYDGVDFRLQRGDRVALIGPNGAGKSTLLKVLAGMLPFEGGRRVLGHNIAPAYYAQHALDALDPRHTVIGELSGAADMATQPQVRGILAAFLFDAEEWEKPVAVLSGGEKARLALAKLLLRPANVLLLDEPTNHLDLKSRSVLEKALTGYTGTLCFISHDRYFINSIATSVCDVDSGHLESYPGTYEEYRRHHQERATGGAAPAGALRRHRPSGRSAGGAGKSTSRGAEKSAPAEEKPVAVSPPAPKVSRARSRERKRREAEARQRFSLVVAPLRKRIETLEQTISTEERKLKAVDYELASPAVYGNAQKARGAGQLRAKLKERLDALTAEWERLSAQVEAAARKMNTDVAKITTD